MILNFTKMHGLGNDFVVVDGTHVPFQPNTTLLHRLTDRRLGVGCDQVLVVDPAPAPDVDFGYRIYNADGSEVGQCGNGARCLARFVAVHGLSCQRVLRVRTSTSTLALHLLENDQVCVDMGAPRLEPVDIPMVAATTGRAARYELKLPDGRRLDFGAVGMGNPHAVIEVPDVETAAVAEIGEALQHHAAFPERVNVGFVQFVEDSHAKLRVFERGAGETLACGSGACAAFVAGRLWNRLAPRADIQVRGGTLSLAWAGEGQPVYMTGPAEIVFEGSIEWPN